MAEIFLRDLSASLRARALEHDRFLLFAELLDIEISMANTDISHISTRNQKLLFNKKNNSTCCKLLLSTLCALRRGKSPFVPDLSEVPVVVNA